MTAASTWWWRRSASTTWQASPGAWPRPGGSAPRWRPACSRRAGPYPAKDAVDDALLIVRLPAAGLAHQPPARVAGQRPEGACQVRHGGGVHPRGWAGCPGRGGAPGRGGRPFRGHAAARRRRAPGHRANAVALPFRDGSFDLVVAAFCLNHLGSLAEQLGPCRAGRRRDGRRRAPPAPGSPPGWWASRIGWGSRLGAVVCGAGDQRPGRRRRWRSCTRWCARTWMSGSGGSCSARRTCRLRPARIKVVSAATGVHPDTVARDTGGGRGAGAARTRAPGGRKPVTATDPRLVPALLAIVDPGHGGTRSRRCGGP